MGGVSVMFLQKPMLFMTSVTYWSMENLFTEVKKTTYLFVYDHNSDYQIAWLKIFMA